LCLAKIAICLQIKQMANTPDLLHEVKGAIKQNAGELTKNPNLEADGRAEKNAGKDQKTVGKIEKAVEA
jgi:uncharacterized protein YjbJ (UPF0337 family)